MCWATYLSQGKLSLTQTQSQPICTSPFVFWFVTKKNAKSPPIEAQEDPIADTTTTICLLGGIKPNSICWDY